jgi:plasmid stabilization system protein ParE
MIVRYRSRAQEDIETIYRGIAEDNPGRAQRVEDGIRAHAEMLGREPELGVAMGHKDARRWPMPKLGYAIFYRIDWDAEVLEVLRIIAGKQIRDLKRVPQW